MKTRLALTLICIAFTPCFAQGHRPKPPLTSYELYSWEKPVGQWNFSLLPMPSGVYLTPDRVFGNKHLLVGVDELKRAITKMPAGTQIYWSHTFDSAVSASESKRLSMPPSMVVQDIRRHAETTKHHLEVF